MDTSIENFLSSHPFAETTKAKYASILINLEGLPLSDWQSADLLNYLKSKITWGNSTQCLALHTIKKYLRWKYGNTHPALNTRLKKIAPRRQRTLSMDQARDLLAMFNPHTPKGARDLAIAALALDTGLRCSELCRLTPKDFDLDNRTLSVIVKGGQWANAVYSPATANCIYKWLAFRDPKYKTIFYSLHFSCKGHELKREGMNTIMRYWGKSLGFKISPHDLRRSFATLTTILGAPSRVVQVAGRWSQIQMVELYTRDIDQSLITPFLPTASLIEQIETPYQ